MSDRKTIRYQPIIQRHKGKEQREVTLVDYYKAATDVQQALHAHMPLMITELKDVEETIFPVRERLEGFKMPLEQPHVKIVEGYAESGNLFTCYIESLNVTAPDRSKNLFVDTDYGVMQAYLPEGRPAFVEGRGGGEYDELVTKCNELKVANAELANRLSVAVRERDESLRVQDVVQAALTARTDGRVRMTESYEGIVRHVGRDDVVVLFEVDDDLVEHTYTRDQFVDSRLPVKGDRLAVYVHVAQLPPEELAEDTDEAKEGIDEQARRRRTIGPPPREV